MVGNETDARRAYDGELAYLGAGCDRIAYLEGNVVYKVARSVSVECFSRAEYQRVRNFEAMSPHVKVPNTSMYDVDGHPVIAMEYITGEPVGECFCEYSGDTCDNACLDEWEITELWNAGLTDICYGNVIRDSFGNLVIVDLGE